MNTKIPKPPKSASLSHQRVSDVLQSKTNNQSKRGPIAPPAFRPQPTPRVLQTKTVSRQPQHPEQVRRQPVAPPVYRPETKQTVQPKTSLRGNQVVQRAL